MDMPRVETLEHAKHFIRGPQAYEGMPSPWRARIKSYQRPESLAPTAADDTQQDAGAPVQPLAAAR